MSCEGWVTPAEEMLNVSPREVTPASGEGALGKWRVSSRTIIDGNDQRHRAGGITMLSRGVCKRVLKPRAVWEDPSGIAAAANRTREIRPSGMRGGLAES